MTKLLECPFCDKTDEENIGLEFNRDSSCPYYVECYWCGAQAPGADNEEEAIENWNNREYKKIKSGRELTQNEKDLLERVKVKFGELSELMSEVKLLF